MAPALAGVQKTFHIKSKKKKKRKELMIVLGLNSVMVYFNALRNGNCIWQHLTIMNMKLTKILRLLQVHYLLHFPYFQNIASSIFTIP